MSPLLQTFANASVRGWRGANGFSSSYELISTLTANGTATDLFFSSIPQTYKHLQARIVLRSNIAAANHSINLQLNAIGGTSYASHRLSADGTGIVSQAQGTSTNVMEIGFVSGSSYTGDFGTLVVDFLDYTSTAKNKTVRSLAGHANAGSKYMQLYSGLFMNTAAINSIDFFVGGGGTSISTGSRISLYGIKG